METRSAPPAEGRPEDESPAPSAALRRLERHRLLARLGVAAVLIPILLVALLPARAPLERADFVFNNHSEISTLDPAKVRGVREGRIVKAIFEGLVQLDPRTLDPLPAAAESWSVNPAGRRYTFRIREDARWSNGDPVTAHDFVWSFRRALEPETAASYAYLYHVIEGAREYATGRGVEGEPIERDWSLVAVRATDDLTLEIGLEAPTPYFLELLTLCPFLPVHRDSLEAMRERHPETWQTRWVRPENIVTNGPYEIEFRRINERIRLRKNETHWAADRVAFRTIDALAIENGSTALNMYLKGEIDWLDGAIPTSLLASLQRREDYHSSPYLGSYFYRFNTTKPPLDDRRVRRALSMAVDRAPLCAKILGGGERPILSFFPPGLVSEYQPPQAPPFGPKIARTLLEQAGYGEKGKPFPVLELHYNTSEIHRDLAEVVASNWKEHLGIDVRLVNQEWKAFLDTQSNLDYDISRSSWIGDYRDPSSFLEIFLGDSSNNRTGWSSEAYDNLVRVAAGKADVAERYELLAKAEEILLNELPIIPIYGYSSQNLVNPRLGGFFENSLNEQSPRFWYWMDDNELNHRRKQLAPRTQIIVAPGPRGGLYSPAALAARETAPPEPQQRRNKGELERERRRER